MRTFAFFGATAVVLCVANGLIIQKEMKKASAETVYLMLAPVDPRSLMMGDYMALNYDLSNTLRSVATADGSVVVSRDSRKVGSFAGLYVGKPLNAGELVLKFRVRGVRYEVGPTAYYFQEGKAESFWKAKYGELRVTSDGDCLLIGLCNENLVRIDAKNE